ncbi:MAG TPA: L,D-transpeptidase family protein [Steroidobacteraceae bacterium]|nr:L,D-transpeptidase family protein [Steroidobacteraceae bacterium]
MFSTTLLRLNKCLAIGGLAVLLMPAAGWAAVLQLPASGDLIGEAAEVTAAHDDTLIDIARRFGLGYEEVVNANPGVDPWLPGAGTTIRLPLRRVLPDAPREGIVVNLPEHRLYYFPAAKPGEPRTVVTYPVSVGKMDWATPLGLTHIAAKIKDPPWYPPESVRTEHAQRGDILPKMVPPGPDNPLGQFAMRLAIPGGGYLIHGTNKPAGVGMQVTHGCMRLYPEDIEELFKRVAVDTPVRIINQPHKVGWAGGQLYVEVHPPLEATDSGVYEPDRTALARLIANAVRGRPAAGGVLWVRAETAFEEARGIPMAVTEPGSGAVSVAGVR